MAKDNIMKSILIVEDDITFGMMLKTWLGKKGFEVDSTSNIARAKRCIEAQMPDLILSDLRLPDQDGIHLLKWMNEQHMDIPLIIMTGYADIQSAVQAIKLGARDYIAKPVNPEELLKKMSEALQGKENGKPVSDKQPSAQKQHSVTSDKRHAYLEGESDAAKQLYNYVGLVAPTNMSVLINGASGTGKEYIAHRFVAANGGTIFLDEIGNLSYEVQIQLLRALQERRIRPLGSTQEVTVDIRLVSATNENLESAIEKGTFRQDLYHRINEFTLRMPTLKERGEDILLFANFFLDQANRELDKQLIGFDAKASRMLLDYHWPGNLRQMKNIIKRATLLAQGSFITPVELGADLLETPSTPSNISLKNEETEKEHILEALRQTGNNKSKAAQMLDIDRKTLYNKLKLYGIDL